VEQFPGFSVEDDRDLALPLANGLLVDEQLPKPIKARRRGIRLEHNLVIATHRGVTDLEHTGDLGVGCYKGPGANESHDPPVRVAVGMKLLRAGGHVTVAGPAKALHGREHHIDNGTMSHKAIHHGPSADLVATLQLGNFSPDRL
jgi:hypothetical protein